MRKYYIWIILFVLLASFSSAQTLQEILVRKVEMGTEILLRCDQPMEYKDLTSSGSDHIVLDLKGAGSLLPGESYLVNRGGIVEASVSSFKSQNILRVALVLTIPVPYEIRMEGNDLVVTSLMGPQEPFDEWRASEARAEPPSPLPPPEVVPAPQPLPEPKAEPEPELKHKPKPKESPPKRRGGPKLTLDLEDADLLTVLRGLSEVSGIDIVAGKGVAGTVTIRLRDKPWREALDLILRAAGFDYVEEKGVIRVATPADIAREREERELAAPMINRVYKIEFATANEILPPIQKTLSKRGHVEVDVRTNSLVATDIQDNFNRIEELIAILDTRTPQVEIQARIVDLNADFTRGLGIDWTLTGLESRRSNIKLGAEVHQPAATENTVTIGTVWDFAKIDATLTLLEEEGNARTIANPRMTASNNKLATIFAGKRVTLASVNLQGVTTLQTFDAGTRLQVTPHINSLEEITMEIRTEVNSVDESSALSGTPIVTTNEAQTNQLVRDGETMVMGGLITKEESKRESGIPILKDIPLLGFLFKSTSTKTTEREVLIFITPHIIKQGEKMKGVE